MKSNMKLASDLPPRSPEREALAEAIERHRNATVRLAKLKAAHKRAEDDLYGADGAIRTFDKAEIALKEAKANESKHLAAVATGEADGDEVKTAELALAEADARWTKARKTRDGLKAEIEATEREIISLWDRRDKALRAVLRAEAADFISALMQQTRSLQEQIGANRAVLMLLNGATFGDDREAKQPVVDYLAAPAHPAEWNYKVDKHPALAPWFAALEALGQDADAPLPV
jgi:hypothetical protein